MSADVAQPPSPPRILGGSRGSSEPHQQQHHQHHQHHKQLSSSGSSSLRLSDEPEPGKSPQSSSSLTTGSGTSSSNASGYSRRDGRRRSECTDTGSIGYGSSAPLESETSYSSHPGYASAGAGRANCSGKSDLSSPTSHLNGSRMHLHGLQDATLGSFTDAWGNKVGDRRRGDFWSSKFN